MSWLKGREVAELEGGAIEATVGAEELRSTDQCKQEWIATP